MRPFQFPVRSSLLLRPSKYSLHRGEKDRAHEILHRGCSRNFVVFTSRDIFRGKPPFFLRPSPLQRDRSSSLRDNVNLQINEILANFHICRGFNFSRNSFFMNYRKNVVLFFICNTVHEEAKVCLFV